MGRVFERINVGQPAFGVDKHGMAASGLDHRNAEGIEFLDDIFVGPDAISEIVLIDDFVQPLGQCFQIAPGKSAIGGETFSLDKADAGLIGKGIIIEGDPATDIAKGILLGAHGHAIGHREVTGRARCP